MFISNQLPGSLQNVYWTRGKDKPNTIFSKDKIYETLKKYLCSKKSWLVTLIKSLYNASKMLWGPFKDYSTIFKALKSGLIKFLSQMLCV